MLGPSPEVEDVVQEVFLHVYRSLKSFRGDSRFSTWLYRLAVNVTRMHLRRKPKKPRWRPFLDLQFTKTVDHSWRHFLDLAYWNVELGEDT